MVFCRPPKTCTDAMPSTANKRSLTSCSSRVLIRSAPPSPRTLSCINSELICSRSTQRSEEHTPELQPRPHRLCRLLLEKQKRTRLNSSHVRTSYAVFRMKKKQPLTTRQRGSE